MIEKLIKIATELDSTGNYSTADEIDAMIKSIADRAGIDLDKLISLADNLDQAGDYVTAGLIDELIKDAKKKKEDKRPKPPKKWLDKMIKEIKEEEPKYSKKQALLTVTSLWFDKLSDKEVAKLLKKYK